MVKQVMCVCAGAAVWLAAAAEAKPDAELVGTAEFASFGEVQQKMAGLGATINNPMVPAMIMPILQGKLTEKFGKFRDDAPMALYCYVRTAEIRKKLASNSFDGIDDLVEMAVVYPAGEDKASFIKSHPEAQKSDDGSVSLDDDLVAVYSADGRTCAFAPNVKAAKRALAEPAPAAGARPLMRVDMKGSAFDLLADIQQKVGEEQAKLMEATKPTNGLAGVMASLSKYQAASAKRKSAFLRSIAKATFTADLDDTGFVVKVSASQKPGSAAPLGAGFRLPANALDSVPAKAPMFFAANPLSLDEFRTEAEYRDYVTGAKKFLLGLLDWAAKDGSPKCASIAKELRPAFDEAMAAAIDSNTPSSWQLLALAFGKNNEPYFVGIGECKSSAALVEAQKRLCAAVASAVGKAWPGVVRAEGGSITVDWAKVMDTAAAEAGVKDEARKELKKAKKTVRAILGSNETVASFAATSATGYATYMGTPGSKIEPGKDGEARFKTAVPETASDRPALAFHMSLYSLLRDNVIPIAMKAMPKEAEQIKPIAAVLPPAGANSALAIAGWSGKDGTARLLLRVTADEIRNFGAAANAMLSVSAAQDDGSDDGAKKKKQ